MIHVRLPDGASRALAPASTAADLAAAISPSLAKRTVAALVDGKITDLSAALPDGAAVELVTRDDPRALELIRHDLAHVLAEAVQTLWPETRTAIGPAIEHGFYYDFDRDTPFTPEDLPVIEKKMREIVAARRPFAREAWRRAEVRAHFETAGETYKLGLLDAIPAGEPVTIYRQGDWLDLCRGPHMRSTADAGTAFKLTHVAGAYWRGDAKNRMLSRIYGVAFADKPALESHLTMMAEAEKRDHRRLGREMDLFHFEEVAPGSVFWHPRGWRLFQTLIGYMRTRQEDAGYVEVNSPDIMERTLWETSGHWQNYRANMFLAKTEDERDYALKPMNCPGHMLIYGQGTKSYRDLPLKLAEFGKVHRYEPSGALHGLLRVRSFTQNDAHIYCTPEQLAEECLKVNDLVLSIYRDFGFEDVSIKLSTRPENRIGSDESWDRSEEALRTALDTAGHAYTIFEGEGAFYGPKLEYVLRDAIGRDWQCGTLQVDFNLPERFGTTYVAPSCDKLPPVMLHRALFGSLERFTGILIEHHAGHLPLWLGPVQAVVATVTGAADDWARDVARALRSNGLRVETDLRNEKIGYKVREHALKKVPVQIALGAREAEDRTVTIRRHGAEDTRTLAIEDAVDSLVREAQHPCADKT
ncbi:threonyl-tRNA synthetase [Roseivivax halotolerans]|uniref:Threonine--tRNA ligase n=1 Tax=Roseivivax halotolerans TaxID=93684 RepID=A0A1I5ZXG8_9RHOB|nr:threonine--tRNA ligase [Roseivivax halotolerans]SFQ61072.1 threonyl-tRNA synthetase [Roseivivax halotolerans]